METSVTFTEVFWEEAEELEEPEGLEELLWELVNWLDRLLQEYKISQNNIKKIIFFIDCSF